MNEKQKESERVLTDRLDIIQNYLDDQTDTGWQRLVQKVNMNQNYNGWTNYETWRVNLEIVDSYDWQELNDTVEDIAENNITSIVELADYIKDMVESYLECDDNVQEMGLRLGYAMAFISEVNWYEIAEYVKDSYPEVIKNI